jgi:peptide/nickel transport system permease protein
VLASPVNEISSRENKSPVKEWFAVALYIVRRSLVIAATIVLGVFLTVWIANKDGQIDLGVRRQIDRIVVSKRLQGYFNDVPEEEMDSAREELFQELADEAGLSLPTFQRNLKWTFNALRYDWGNVLNSDVSAFGGFYDQFKVNKILKSHFPNTLLLVGTADLIIFLVGIPLALVLASRKVDQWTDRLFSILTPLSSIPSWVHGIFLVAIFAIQLRILPYSGKFDNLPAETWFGNALVVGKHMVLPVISILLSLFFQLVYTWRTFFLVYSQEDYVDLAKAKGLTQRNLERRYILHPTLPYVMTSFALTLVGFWQMTIALEYFFRWPGIGLLYINSLPRFTSDGYYPGEMSVVVGIVVTFALLLGLIVLLLDLIYVWVDPRLRIDMRRRGISSVKTVRTPRIRNKKKGRSLSFSSIKRRTVKPTSLWVKLKMLVENGAAAFQRGQQAFREIMGEILKQPLALVGLVIILFLVLGSIYAVVGLPYVKIGEEWGRSGLSGKIYTPKNAPPIWVNWFRKNDLPPTMTFSSLGGTISKSSSVREDGFTNYQFSLMLDYPYQEFPQDLLLYIESQYDEKFPFLIIRWITPDGREINPSSSGITKDMKYTFSDHILLRKYVRQYAPWSEWIDVDDQNRVPAFYVMFADPEANQALTLPGTYQLEITAMTFEEGSDVDIEFVLMGRVSGWAGTDHLRRNLVIPLFWGLPFALGFGFVGAALTSMIALVVAAAGVWYGGWVDDLLQRLTEANMILPVLAVSILVFALYNINLWIILGVVIFLKAFSSPAKSFRAAFMQIKEAHYIEGAQAYGASDLRIIFKYMVPRIFPVLIPQIVTLIPSLVFLEATLGIFNVFDPRFPTWGRVIYGALVNNALWGGYQYWVLEPLSLLLLTALGFSLFGFGLERVLNPRLQNR